MKRSLDQSLVAAVALVLASVPPVAQAEAGRTPEAEDERSIVGFWIAGEDIDVVFSFCEDGTFTKWYTYYYRGKCQDPGVHREKVGCGTFTVGKDEISGTIDLQFLDENACIALGRFEWNPDSEGNLDLNVAECGDPRPDTPYYYPLRPGGTLDCTCLGEGGCQIEDVEMVRFSGRFGYGLTGAYGFVGSLTKEQLTDQTWHLEGEFVFPTEGYVVGTPVCLIAESYPEQVSVTIGITRPAPDNSVAQVITHVPVTLAIAASNEASFRIQTWTCEEGGEGEGEGEPIHGCFTSTTLPRSGTSGGDLLLLMTAAAALLLTGRRLWFLKTQPV